MPLGCRMQPPFKGLLDTHDSHSPTLKLFAAFGAEFVINIIFR